MELATACIVWREIKFDMQSVDKLDEETKQACIIQ